MACNKNTMRKMRKTHHKEKLARSNKLGLLSIEISQKLLHDYRPETQELAKKILEKKYTNFRSALKKETGKELENLIQIEKRKKRAIDHLNKFGELSPTERTNMTLSSLIVLKSIVDLEHKSSLSEGYKEGLKQEKSKQFYESALKALKEIDEKESYPTILKGIKKQESKYKQNIDIAAEKTIKEDGRSEKSVREITKTFTEKPAAFKYLNKLMDFMKRDQVNTIRDFLEEAEIQGHGRWWEKFKYEKNIMKGHKLDLLNIAMTRELISNAPEEQKQLMKLGETHIKQNYKGIQQQYGISGSNLEQVEQKIDDSIKELTSLKTSKNPAARTALLNLTVIVRLDALEKYLNGYKKAGKIEKDPHYQDIIKTIEHKLEHTKKTKIKNKATAFRELEHTLGKLPEHEEKIMNFLQAHDLKAQTH